jgi:hypothetical protein
MTCFRAVVLALLFMPAALVAAPAYDVSGLHVGLTFGEAIIRAQALGGVCTPIKPVQGDAAVAQCDYPQCVEDGCEGESTGHSRFTVAAQPVLRVGLEAPDANSPMTRISIMYDGDSDVVEEFLKGQYGRPYNDTSENAERSWTHARRVSWKQGRDNLGLLKTAHAISLTRNPEE